MGVELKWILLGKEYLPVSDESQTGREAWSTEKVGGELAELWKTMSVKPGVPVPLTYGERVVEPENIDVVLAATICRVTVTSLGGAGALVKLRVAICVLVKPPHPDAACTVNVTGVADAVPPASELTVSHALGAWGTLVDRIVNGVPPVAADATETVDVVMLPHVFGVPGVRVQ
jgi:hypothetical protein